MSTMTGARLHILADAILTPALPETGAIRHLLENAGGGRRWTDGQSSGEADTVYFRDRDDLAASGKDSYDLLAAGALVDVFGATIDIDELKALVLVVDSGSVRIKAPAADYLPIFGGAGEYVLVSTSLALDFGAGGLPLGSSSKFDIEETTGTATASYRLLIIGAA